MDERMDLAHAQKEAKAQNFNEIDGLYHVNGKAYDPKDNFHIVSGVNQEN